MTKQKLEQEGDWHKSTEILFTQIQVVCEWLLRSINGLYEKQDKRKEGKRQGIERKDRERKGMERQNEARKG